MEIKELGERIKKYRKLKGFTQEELAEESGISTMSIRRYESGERIAKPQILNKIADALHIPLHALYPEYFQQLTEQSQQTLTKESAFSDYLDSLGFEYIPTLDNPYSEYDNSDRGIYWKSENITIPLTEKEYRNLQANVDKDVVDEIRRLREYKNI